MTLAGASLLMLISLALGFNHVVIKLVNEGLQPVFAAGLRSVGGALCIWLWIRVRGNRLEFKSGTILPGLAIGLCFAVEFLGLFLALDLTTVSRTAVIFYTMPIWLSLVAHFFLPGERLTGVKTIGLALAFGGVAWAIADQGSVAGGSLRGDLFALMGSFCWMGVALIARMTRLREVSADMQMFWQLFASGPLLLLAAPFFGPFIRELVPLHWLGLAYQTIFIAAAAFLAWFWLLNRYKASSVASFAFLSPVIGVTLGWLILGETITPALIAQLFLVALGILLINRPRRAQS